jgi:hypothetical protein
MVLAIVVIVAVVVFLAVGRGGEMSAERSDYVPLDLGPVSATDVALLRPPMGLWGYNMQATDEAMERVAESIRERDVRIVALEQLVTDLSRDHAPMPLLASPYVGARHRRAPAETAEAEAVKVPYEAPAPQTSATETPAYDSPAYDTPAYEAPAYEALGYEGPATDAPKAEETPAAAEPAPTEPAWPPFETIRPPFERPKPSGEFGPPERSHD